MARPGARDGGDKERFWRRLLGRWRQSGQRVRDFCTEHQISEPCFFFWRRTIAERDQRRREQRQRNCHARDEVDTPTTFVPLRVVPTTGMMFEVVLQDGCLLRVPPNFDAGTCRQLLALLREERPC
jgi:hypothetical protein